MTTIAYLGPPGTFSEAAVLAFDPGATRLPLASMPAVVAAAEAGQADIAMLPIENVIEGGVSTTLDLLIHETNMRIMGETVLPIRHFLLARPGTNIAEVQVLYGHPQSLGQCRHFIEQNLPQATTVASLSNSAAPAEALADSRPAAAIGTLRAAELTGAAILAHDIQDRMGNVTRFIALSRSDHPPTGDDKTSFCFGFAEEDRAGSLVGALLELAIAGINMTRLESRPSKQVLGSYIFVVDINGHREEPRVAEALKRLGSRTGLLKIFGSYPCWRGNLNGEHG
jgi:prephenate dehydratase